jgi:hypothetical protein
MMIETMRKREGDMAFLKSSLWPVGLLILTLFLLTNCGGDDTASPTPATDQSPTVDITAPADGAVLPAGQAVSVSVLATDDQAIARIELYVNNSLIESRVTPPESAFTTVSEAFAWSASIIGSHTIQARAYDAAGQMGASRIVGVEVLLPGTTPIAPADTPVPGTPAQPGENTPVPPPPTAPPATATEQSAMVTANVNANVRSGPGTNYSVVGSLAEGQSAPVTGRNSDSSWWQINYQGSAAWIADSVATANQPAYSAPIVSAPPPPPTNTPVPPTATSPPPATAIPTNPPATTGLWADQLNVSAGQCTTLHWDYAAARAFYVSLAYGADKEKRDLTGSQQVCPSITTNYETTVVKQDGSQEFPSVTINVGGSGCGDPMIQRFVATTYQVAAGEAFSIFWDVECAKAVRFVHTGVSEEPVGGHSSKVDVRIDKDTLFQLRVDKTSGGSVNASFTVNVK